MHWIIACCVGITSSQGIISHWLTVISMLGMIIPWQCLLLQDNPWVMQKKTMVTTVHIGILLKPLVQICVAFKDRSTSNNLLLTVCCLYLLTMGIAAHRRHFATHKTQSRTFM